MAIEKYLNVGKFSHHPDAPPHDENGCKPSTLVVEADRTLAVCTDGKEQPLGISPPHGSAGELLCIEVENIPPPAIAEIRHIDGRKVRHGDQLSADELANLVYVAQHNAIPDKPPAFAYGVTSPSGGHGRQTLRFCLVETKAATIQLAPIRM